MAKSESIKLITPRGAAYYPAIHKKDTKFDDDGCYKADIAVDAGEAQDFIKRLQAIHKDHTGKAAPKSKNSMFEMELDKDTGEETGRVIIKSRVKDRTLKNGDPWRRQPKVFDGQNNPVSPIPAIGGGSEMRVQLEVYCWETPAGKKGVSLQPLNVMLLKLVEFSGSTSSPFDEEPDAEFFAEEEDDPSPFAEDNDSADF